MNSDSRTKGMDETPGLAPQCDQRVNMPENEDFFQRIFKDNELSAIPDYPMPRMDQLTHFRLMNVQKDRC